MLIFLIGFMGSGKSTTGRLLARDLSFGFADIDNLLEEREGMAVTEIFARKGEEYFRKAESEILDAILGFERTVVACGGGTPCFHDNMRKMKEAGVTVYLKVPPDILARRLSGGGRARPLIAGMKGARLNNHIRRLLAGREGWYRQSDIVFNSAESGTAELFSLLRPYLEQQGR